MIDRLQRSARLSRRQEYVGVGLLWVVVTGWVWARLTQGWVGIDDGAFAQIATRVLEGQLPHREFADVYTGGMTFMNAATMYVFGEDIVVLRYPLFVAFLGLVPAAYYIARSVTGPWTALLAAALVCTWSVPVYPAPMPSWYLLMFSVYSAACLIRWRAIRSSRWLLSAGLLAGLAVAFKITGVYLVVAVLLFLVFVHPKQPRVGRSVGLDWPSIGAVALVGGLLASVLGSRLGSSELVNLALPVAAIALVVVVERRRRSPTELGSVAGTTLRRSVLLFLTGVGLPLVALLVPYLLAGAVGDLVEGVFVSPQSRRDTAYWRTPAPASVVFALALAALVFARGRLSRPGRLIVDVGLTAAAFGALLVAADDQSAYLAYWVTGRGMGTVIVVIGAAVLLRRWRSVEIERREILFLLLALAALTTLVQFPFGIPLYYCYAAPLVALAAVAVVSRSRTRDAWLTCVLVGAFALYGAAYLDRASFNTLASRFVRDGQATVLDSDRASIRVYPAEADATRHIVALLRQRSVGRYTFAGPDTPQLYFLADLRNPTRSLFDFLDTTDSARGKALVQTLRRTEVTAIAINLSPDLSDPLDEPTLRRLERMYPNFERIGTVDVRWIGR